MMLGAICVIFFISYCEAKNDESYIAAVVEFAAEEEPRPHNMLTNLKGYLHFIEEAKREGADIIVFPEIGLAGYGDPIEEMTSVVPDPKDEVTPCDEKESEIISTTILRELSCAAKNQSIYVTVNLPEKFPCSDVIRNCSKKGWVMYNTNVVFNRLGQIIARIAWYDDNLITNYRQKINGSFDMRYRKSNLFGESDFHIPENPEISIFETDFGVRFATFICFDIFFERPALALVRDYGITDIIFTTAWFAMFPYHSAVQFQSAWSYAEDVNLLAAGYNDPPHGSTGSGIHLGRSGTANYTTSDEHQSKLLTAVVPKKEPRQKAEKPFFTIPANVQTIKPKCSALVGCSPDGDELDRLSEDGKMLWRLEDMHKHTTDLIDGYSYKNTLCFDSLCCNFNLEYEPLNGTRYRAFVFRGVTSFLHMATGGIQSCGIVACSNESLDSCAPGVAAKSKFKHIAIEGTFDGYRATVTPSIMNSSFAPIPMEDFRFSEKSFRDKCNVSMELVQPVQNLITFGIHGRIFTLDGGLLLE